jgi:hypothetical protein
MTYEKIKKRLQLNDKMQGKVVYCRPFVLSSIHNMSLLSIIMGVAALFSGLAVAAVCLVGCLVWLGGLVQEWDGAQH